MDGDIIIISIGLFIISLGTYCLMILSHLLLYLITLVIRIIFFSSIKILTVSDFLKNVNIGIIISIIINFFVSSIFFYLIVVFSDFPFILSLENSFLNNFSILMAIIIFTVVFSYSITLFSGKNKIAYKLLNIINYIFLSYMNFNITNIVFHYINNLNLYD
jgi:hypothetical protein